MLDDWFDLPFGCVGSIAHPRKTRLLQRRPPRFIVLGPPKEPGRLRPTRCAGDWIDGRCVVDIGDPVLPDELALELERECAQRFPVR